jgi:hypothetical protein
VFAQHIEVVDETIQTLLPAKMGRIIDLNPVLPTDNLCGNEEQF